jgi:hypothetical protein
MRKIKRNIECSNIFSPFGLTQNKAFLCLVFNNIKAIASELLLKKVTIFEKSIDSIQSFFATKAQ